MDIIGKRTLPELLLELTAEHPDKHLLFFEDSNEHLTSYTYSEFTAKVIQMGIVFKEKGVGKGDAVTLHLTNGPEFLIAWFALSYIGAIMVPTNPQSPEKEMEYIIEHSNSVLVVTEEIHLRKFQSIRPNLSKLRDILLVHCQSKENEEINLEKLMAQVNSHIPFEKMDGEDVAAMLYTSGTTSLPKACMITHANYLFAGEVMSKSIRLSPEDRQFISLPLFHGNAQYYSTMSALTVGGSIALVERFSASRYFKQAKRLNATVGSLFAAPLRMILAKEYDPLDRENPLRLIMFAQTLTKDQVSLLEDRYKTKLIQLYGMTETIGTPLINPIDGKKKNQGIGKPALGYEVKVIDEYGNEVLPGKTGQLIVKGIPGRTIMKGYFQNEKATNETIKDGWLFTGDNVSFDEEGYFFFEDRLKDMIKRSGENVATREVEDTIKEHTGVFDCAVIGVPDEMRDEAIKAFVIRKESHQHITQNDIITFCEERLSKFKVPQFIEFVPDFPRTSVGKIQKHKLRK